MSRARLPRRDLALAMTLAVGMLTACTPSIVPLATEPTPDASSRSTADTIASTVAHVTPHADVAPSLPHRVSRAAAVAMLRASLDSAFQQPTFRTATWGALVVSEQGDTLYAHNAATLLIPASNMKIVTATTALAQLGPDFRFRDTALALAAGDTVPSDFGPMYDTIFVRDHPLRDVLAKMLKPSQNKLAEEIARTVALERTGSPSRDSAVAVTARQLATWNVPSDGYILFDGSGYDRANYLSAETIVQLLTQARRDTTFSVFYNALPIAGVDGTLVRRMRATSAERNAHAKTGSLHAIRALSGYVTTVDGEELIFSFLCNAYTTMPDTVLHIMDHAVAQLAELPANTGSP